MTEGQENNSKLMEQATHTLLASESIQQEQVKPHNPDSDSEPVTCDSGPSQRPLGPRCLAHPHTPFTVNVKTDGYKQPS